MRQSFNISFYCRPSKTNNAGYAPVELSICINGKRVFVQLPRKEKPTEFKKALAAKRDNPIKAYLEEVRRKVGDIETEMMKNNLTLTAEALREHFMYGGVKQYTIGDLFDEYLEYLSKRVGIDLTIGAYKKYENAVTVFLKHISKDNPISSITNNVIKDFLAELNQIYAQSTVCGIMTKIKTIITYAIDNDKLKVNPFCNIKYSRGYKDIEYLTEEEIQAIIDKEMPNERMENIKELALFQMATGLAYVDMASLEQSDIKDIDGTYYIKKKRHKTGTEFTAVILPFGVDILKKKGFNLNIISNQKLNSYLKELQTICNIRTGADEEPQLEFHSHLFRKTYGSYLLNRGVRIEAVQKALGHSSVKTTQQVYAAFRTRTIVNEVQSALDSKAHELERISKNEDNSKGGKNFRTELVDITDI